MATLKSFSIDGRTVKNLFINGKAVKLGAEPVACDALCFTAEQANSTVRLHKQGAAPTVNLQTSTDGKSWTPYAVEDIITLANEGDKVYFKAVDSNASMCSTAAPWMYNCFQMTGRIAASGNVNSLLEEDEETARTMSLEGKTYCFCRLFGNCLALTQAPELPATTLANSCYINMFLSCSALTQAPALPATTLTIGCYGTMFYHCASLTQAPELPATTLAESCYSNMFRDCFSLNSIKVAFTNWDPSNATSDWLPANTGTFECPSDLITNTADRNNNTVPSSWTMVAV